MDTIGNFLGDVAAKYGPKEALAYKYGDATDSWTYSDLLERANKVAAWLQKQGIRKGDRVVMWAPNSPWWVAAYFGGLKVGTILVPLDVRSGADFVRRVVGQTEPKLAFISRAAKVTGATWDYPAPAYPMEDLEALTRGESGEEFVPAEKIEPGDIAELMFTSGTTGDPKGVILTHFNILSNVEGADPLVPDIAEFRPLSILPLSHMFEQTGGMLMALGRGSSICYLEALRPNIMFSALKEHGATVMLLVPQALHLFMSSIEREVAKQGKEKTWKRMLRVARFLPMWARRRVFKQVHERLGGRIAFLISGGAPIAAELVRKWETIGIPILQGYGATETSPVISFSGMSHRNPYTVGRPAGGVEVKTAEDGELLVRGPNVTQGYWHNPVATEQAFEDGWYKTGDLAYFDRRGRIYLHGRKKDMIALANGQKVYPQDVEEALKVQPGVTDAVVVGLPLDEGQDIQVHAVLILDKENPPAPEALVKQANAHLAAHQYIGSFTVWPDVDFPRTHTLKVKKHEVLAAVIAMRAKAEAEKQEKAAGTPELAGVR